LRKNTVLFGFAAFSGGKVPPEKAAGPDEKQKRL
jgi:hypothetical protein